MKLKENFSSFGLDIEARREIIQMGIQKQPRLQKIESRSQLVL